MTNRNLDAISKREDFNEADMELHKQFMSFNIKKELDDLM